MKRARLALTGGFVLLAGALFTPGAGAWEPWPHVHVGPEPVPQGPNVSSFYRRDEPLDYGPYPESWYHWPTLRQALDQYGWFGRRACKGPPAGPPMLPKGEAAPAFALPAEAVPAGARPAPAFIQVIVPADGRIWFDGEPTSQTGPLRRFETPPLEGGRYALYEVKARWRQDGREVSRTRPVRVLPGQRLTVDFLQPGTDGDRGGPAGLISAP
jgi:uncharacterized protein (TIGR03000 family)